MIRLKSLLAACGLLLLLGRPGLAQPDPTMLAAALKEGEVVWYSTLIVNQIVRPLAEAFEKKYPGIKVRYSRASSTDTALKIRNEARARRIQADLFDGSNTVFLLEDANLVAEYRPRSAANYPDNMRDTKGLWTATCLFYWTAAYNTNLVSDADAPKTYADLLNPRWKGKIAWTYDQTPGGPPGFIYNILSTMGQDAGMAYLKKFAENQPVSIPAAQRVVLDKVVSGEYPLSVMILNYHTVISQRQGAPVKWIKMEPLIELMSLTSIVKDGPHPNATRLFVEFMHSDEGQKIFADNDYLPASPAVDAKDPTLKPKVGGFRVNTITPDLARAELAKWTAIYQDLFR